MNEMQEAMLLMKIQRGIKNGENMTDDINTITDEETRDGMLAYQQLKKMKASRKSKKSKPKTKTCKCKA